MNETHKTALHYHNLGFSVFPLKPQAKEPMFGSWAKYQTTRATVSQINNWWEKSEGLNIAIVCGDISKLVVVDVDNKEKLPSDIHFPPTASVTTGRGYHLYYRLPHGMSIKTIKYDWGEVRGNGGYVVAPCSIHPSGKIYEWSLGSLPNLEDIEIFPNDFLNEVLPTKPNQDGRLYEDVFNKGISEGSRNSAMTSVVGKLVNDFSKESWNTTVWSIVQGINDNQCIPPLPKDELEQIFKSICKKAEANKKHSEKPEFKITTGAEMMQIKPNPRPYLIDRLIARRAINAITADTGKGKSLFAFRIVRDIAQGSKLFDVFETNKTKVLIIDQEMEKDLVAERYQKIISDAYQNVDCLVEQSIAINDLRHYEWLRDTIIKNEYGCIVLDTLTNIHSADENSATEMRAVNQLLLKLIQETDVTIIYLHHHRKLGRGEKSSQSSSRGSTEIGAKMDSHLLLESKKEKDSQGKIINNLTIKQVKSRRPEGVESISVDVIYDPESKTTEWKYLGEVKDEMSAVARASEEILKMLKENGEMTRGEIQEESSVGNNAVINALKILVKNNMVDVTTGKEGLHPSAKVYGLHDENDF